MDDRVTDRHACCRVLELRQYALHPGGRDTLVGLFERHFLDALEAAGMHVSGMFEDLHDPERLVWLRGFRSMTARHRALTDFYLTGEVWHQHSRAANATMIDSDDVLLLAPVYVGGGYPDPSVPRVSAVDPDRPNGLLVVDVVPLGRLHEVGIASENLADHVVTAAHAEGVEVLLVAVTHPEPNDFLALPVRDECVAVWLARYPSPDLRERIRSRLGARPDDEQVRLGPVIGSQIA
jgi:hypothetical protein